MSYTIQKLTTVLFALILSMSTLADTQASPAADQAPTEGPKGYVLSAAYPNPFNPTTTFSLTVHERQEVRVWVHNMLGQPVAELYQGTMQAGETQTFTFDAGSLPSGIYFYRVTGERFTAARQITLIK